MKGLIQRLAAAMLVVTLVSGQQGGCPTGWTLRSTTKTCYSPPGATVTYMDAESSCKNNLAAVGGTLLTVTDATEDSFIANEFSLSSLSDRIWLGLTEERGAWRFLQDSQMSDDVYLRDQGCYIVTPSNYLDVYTTGSEAESDDACQGYCRTQNYMYSGVRYNNQDVGQECGCGNDPSAIFSGSPAATTCNSQTNNKVKLRYVNGQTFGLWASNQPNHFDGMYQGCLAVKEQDKLKFVDETCTKNLPFMCSLNLDQAACTAIGQQGLATGYLATAQMCVQPDPTASNWFEAKYSCEQKSGNLIKIATAEVYQELLDNTVIQGILDNVNNDYWIGGVSGLWTWPNGQIPTYAPWIRDAPQANVVGTGQCAKREPNGVWKIEQCDGTLAYICKYAYDEVDGRLTIGNLNYEGDLLDMSSQAYQNLVTTLSTMLTNACRRQITGCMAKNLVLSAGSVVVDFKMFFPANQGNDQGVVNRICQNIATGTFYSGVDCSSVVIGSTSGTAAPTTTQATTTQAPVTTTTTTQAPVTTTTQAPDTTTTQGSGTTTTQGSGTTTTQGSGTTTTQGSGTTTTQASGTTTTQGSGTTTTQGSVTTTAAPGRTTTSTQATPVPQTGDDDDDDGLDVGVIVAIVVVCVVVALLTIRLLIYFCCQSRKNDDDTMRMAMIKSDQGNKHRSFDFSEEGHGVIQGYEENHGYDNSHNQESTMTSQGSTYKPEDLVRTEEEVAVTMY